MNDALAHGLWAGSEAWAVSEALGSDHASDLAMVAAADLFDGAWYLEAYPDVAAHGIDPATHFVSQGWKESRKPNFYFDTTWYRAINPDVARVGINPVLHDISVGEGEGRAPSELFDLAWYGSRHQAEPGQTLLAHFLSRRRRGGVSPLPEFDADYYLTTYPDVAAAGVDPCEHYLLYGFREGRNPSAGFDTRFYRQRYLGGATDENPLLHYRRHRHALRLHTAPPAGEADVFEEIRRNTHPGPLFESFAPLPPGARRRAQVLAFYLPQFHPIAENDAWWGTGFTEWTALGRAVPRFAGHYQPRIPRDLGHYRLGDTPEGRAVMRRQVALARDAGLGGFVHYFYWFNRRRLLEAPLEAWLADTSIDFPFCLMWANENWTRRWDGSDQEVLIAQDYDRADDAALVDCLARHFRDPRYIRLGGRPLLMVYRAADIPDTKASLERWRGLFRRRHDEDPLWVMAQSFDALDPRDFGFDAAVEFPPHKLAVDLPRRNDVVQAYDPRFSAHVYDYDDMVSASLEAPDTAFPLIRTAVPSWDNDARRQGAGLVLRGSTPEKYRAWLAELVSRAAAAMPGGLPVVCVNAWNEWAEGAYLEPDQHFGSAYLNATARAVVAGVGGDEGKVLLVGHDAFAAGAQHLLLHLLERFRRSHGAEAEYLLLGDGALAGRYAEAAPGAIVGEGETARLDALLDAWARRGFRAAVVNTVAAAWVVPRLRAAGMRVTLLVHELPGLIAERGLGHVARAAAVEAKAVVFPAAEVRARFAASVGVDPPAAAVLPQGNYRGVGIDRRARRRVRARLGLNDATPLVLGAGYADLRKGFDLFLQAWRLSRGGAVFCWLGAVDPSVAAYLAPEIAAAEATGRFLMPGFQSDVAAWMNAADVFALTSREDPFPTVALEAMSTGLPVACFAGSGGMPETVAGLRAGEAVTMGDAAALARAVRRLAGRPPGERAGLARAAAERFDFGDYARRVLAMAAPEVADISVVVPNWNYARYLSDRLGSVFAQTHPVREVILLDDASTDDSLAVARRVAGEWRRDIRVSAEQRHSGSVFRQWRRAAALARGEFVWIAEADDGADPRFLAALSALMRAQPEMVLAFCDSCAIDAAGAELWPSYRPYYSEAGAVALGQDGMFPARAFAHRFLAERNLMLNVSAVLWRRAALVAALERCGDELDEFRIAGDWRVYLEATAGGDGSVGYLAQPLNHHRRHAASVTSTERTARHLEEIRAIHRTVRARFGADTAMRRRQAAYLREAAHRLGE